MCRINDGTVCQEKKEFYHFLYCFYRQLQQSLPLDALLMHMNNQLMKPIKTITALLALQHLFIFSFSQKNQNNQFERCKGKLPFPVCTVYRPDHLNKANLINCKKCEIEPSPYGITFITDSAAEVRAIHAGIVSKVFTVEEGYAMVTSFGDYYITYYPLTNPTLKKGDPVFSGQPISQVSSSDSAPQINILLSKATTFIDPYKWFKW